MESFAVLDPLCLLFLETTTTDDSAHHKQNKFHVSSQTGCITQHVCIAANPTTTANIRVYVHMIQNV